MKFTYSYILYLAIVVAVMGACSKGVGGVAPDDGSDPGNPHVYTPSDTIPPVLDIFTPDANQVFRSGNAISVTGKISDELGLFQGSVRITNDANGDVLKLQEYEIHGLLSYNFSVIYVVVGTVLSNYTVTVTFDDHGLNKTTKSVKIKVNP